jgi:hypothetical protein
MGGKISYRFDGRTSGEVEEVKEVEEVQESEGLTEFGAG